MRSVPLKDLAAEYENTLANVKAHVRKLNADKKKPGITPKEEDDLTQRIRLLNEECRELRRDIFDMQSYLRAWGELP